MSNDEDTQPSVNVVQVSVMPEQPKTKELPAVSGVEVAITHLTRAVELGFREIRQDVALVSHDLGVVKERVGIIETWKNDQDARTTRTSAGVRGLSLTDAEQQAQLGQERAAREDLSRRVDSLDAKQDIQLQLLQRLVKLTEKPVVKLVATAIGTAILGYLSARGLK